MERLDTKIEEDNNSSAWIAVIFMVIMSIVSFMSGTATGVIWMMNRSGDIKQINYEGKTYLYFENKGMVEK